MSTYEEIVVSVLDRPEFAGLHDQLHQASRVLGPRRSENAADQAIDMCRLKLEGVLQQGLVTYLAQSARVWLGTSAGKSATPEGAVYETVSHLLTDVESAIAEWEEIVKMLMASPGASVLAQYKEAWRMEWNVIAPAFRDDLIRAAERLSEAEGLPISRHALGAWLGPLNSQERRESRRMRRTGRLAEANRERFLLEEVLRPAGALDISQIQTIHRGMFWRAFTLSERLVVQNRDVFDSAARTFAFPSTHPEVLEEMARFDKARAARRKEDLSVRADARGTTLSEEDRDALAERSAQRLSALRDRLAPPTVAGSPINNRRTGR